MQVNAIYILNKTWNILLVLGVASCGQSMQHPSHSRPLVIVDSDDRVPVDAQGDAIPSQMRAFLPAFGRMIISYSDGQGVCTATYLGSGLAITAGHCFADKPTKRVDTRVSCSNVQIEWGAYWQQVEHARGFDAKNPNKDMSDEDPGTSYLTTPCSELLSVEYSNARDYAIFRIDVSNGEPKAKVDYSRDKEDFPEGTPLVTFGYSRGLPLRVSAHCSVGAPMYSKETRFYHDCDTTGGNSGATLINAKTLQIVGIHGSGLGERGTDLGYTNTATRISAVPIEEFSVPLWSQRTL